MATKGITLSKSSIKGNRRRSFKTGLLSKSAISKLRLSRRALVVVLLLASSAVALTSLGIRRAMLSGNAAAFVSQSVPATMTAGAAYAVTVRMLNQGTTTWTPGQAYRLGSQNPQDNTTWMNPNRVNLLPGDSVSPGATTTFSFVVTAPSSPGSYNFQWQMVQEGVEWFGAKTPNIAVQVVPNPPLTRLTEYVYAGDKLITSEEKSCVPTLSPGGANLPQGGGTGSVNVSTSSGCSWMATSNAGWITVTSGSSGAGNGTVSYSVAENSGAQRSSTISINGQAFNISQSPNPASCSYSLNTPGVQVSDQAVSGSFTLTTGGGCPWTATSNASWLSVTSAPSSTGSATINYSVAANSGQQRAGVITVGGQTFTVTQAPNQASCTFALNPSSWQYPVEGGTGSFSITTGAGCHWDAATTYGWITITSAATGTGSGAVGFTVQANNDNSRGGTISVRGQVFTVMQCGFVVSPTSANFTWSGGPGSVSVESGNHTCSWSAVSNASWITITSGGSGTHYGTVNYSVAQYGVLDGVRSGTLTISGHTVTITQTGTFDPCIKKPWLCESSPSTPLDQLAPGAEPRGLTASYFSNTTLSGQPALQRTDAVINFDWADARSGAAQPADGFSARWSGQLDAPSSEAYTFYLYSEGGARLWVNNQLVIDRWRPSSAPYTSSAPIDLKAGEKADVRVEYYNAGGKAAIQLLWSSASTPKQIIPQRFLYPEAATNKSEPTDTNKQTGMLLPPGPDAGPKAAQPQPGVLSRWLASPLGRAGLVLLIACGLLALLLRLNWSQARRKFSIVVANVVSRLRNQIKAQFGELFRIAAAAYYKLHFVVVFGKGLLAASCNKLKFVGHFLAAFLPIFKVLSYGGAVMRLGMQKLAGLLPERARIRAGRALSSWQNSGVARLKPILRRALAITLVAILAAPLRPAEADGLVRAARATWREARVYTSAAANWYGMGGSSDLLNRLINMASGKRPDKVVSAASQAEQVVDLQVCPRQLVMFVGERYILTPVALDSGQKVVHGVGMSWSSSNTEVAGVSSFGQVEAMAVGNATVEVQCGSVSELIQLEVRPGTRPTDSNQHADIDPTNDCAAEQSSAFAPQSAAVASAQQNSIEPDVLLDWDPSSERNSRAADFRNAVGNPRFGTNLSSANYQVNIPVVRVGGRGASASVGMTFNSRVWNVDDGKLKFNYVGAYPAPGWTVGFGKIIRNYNDTATGAGGNDDPGDYLLVTSDGTRIRLASRFDAAMGRWFHESDDGSFLHFDYRSGVMRYPDGSRTIYSSVNGCLLPTAIIGTNGGAITLTYRDYCEGAGCVRVFRHRTALSAIRDTWGRYVTFHYYGDIDYTDNSAGGRPAGELAAIKAPDKDGVQQEAIRVEYQPIILKYDFGGMVVDAPANNSQIQVVRRIYYPRTGLGFLFLDYSSYGMPRKISRRIAMTGAGGTITDGTEMGYTTHNYTTIDPSDPYDRHQVESLNDFPQFTRREEWWQGKTADDGAPTTAPTRYEYSFVTEDSGEVVTIKHVDKNLDEVTTTGIDIAQLSYGKVISVERRKSETDEVLSKQVFTYMTAQDGEVEIKEVETIGEAGQGTLKRFGYGRYGRVSDEYECGYKQAGVYPVIKHTRYDYVDDSGYLAARFLRLVSRISVYDAKNNTNDTDDLLKAKMEAEYDNYEAMRGIESYGLNPSLYPPNHDAAYDQNKTMRGNATAIKTFIDIASQEASTRRVRYDIFGNVVEADMSCCVKKFFGFSGATAYSKPDWVRSGDEAELNLQTNYQSNYFTGLVERETNPDGVWTDYEYDRALRLKRVSEQTGAEVVTQFEQDGNGNDLLAYVSQVSYDDRGTHRVITSKRWLDGSGQIVRSGTGTGDAPDNYDMTATIYDACGRVAKRSNPYLGDASGNPQSGVTQSWTTNTYDELSRVVNVTLPDEQSIQTEYRGATATSGVTVTVTDTVGRKRKRVVDGLGRLVKVIEQNPANGNLEWETNYSYDALDNLTQTNQGGQLRTFTYDAKSRLISETTPEAGKIDYTYTDFDAVKTRKDARLVETTYTYGQLNLLTDVSYNTSNATGVADTARVSVRYKDSSPGKARIEMVTDGAGTESYGYDDFGRLQSSIRMIDGIRYEKRYEYNEAGQMTQMIYPSGKRVKMELDARGRLAAMLRVDASGNMQEPYLSGINYRADGQISSQSLGDGTTESFGYSDKRLQLTSQTVTKGGSTLLNLSYGYQAVAGQMGSASKPGNNGQIVSVNGTVNGQNRDQAFTYDNVGRLVTATGWGAWERRFGYDLFGNRTAVWDAVSGGNQLQNTVIGQLGGIKTNRVASVNGTAFSHDASGNLTGDGVGAYTYNAENQLVSVSGPSSESYVYDMWNHRVKKVVGGVVTHYIWEGNRVIAAYERGGGATQAAGTRYYHHDRLSPRAITNNAGAIVGTMNHLPFGEEVGGIGESTKRKFTTYERDTLLDYAVNRHYDPRHGRFIQADPLGMGAASLTDPQSLNLYSYAKNDPINASDPKGTTCSAEYSYASCGGGGGFWGGGGGGGGGFGNDVAKYNSQYGGMPRHMADALQKHDRRVANARAGWGFAIGDEEGFENESGGGQEGWGDKIASKLKGYIDKVRNETDWEKATPCLIDAFVNLALGVGLALAGPVGAVIGGILDITGTDINIMQGKPFDTYGTTDLVAGMTDFANGAYQGGYKAAGGDAEFKALTNDWYKRNLKVGAWKQVDSSLKNLKSLKNAARILGPLAMLAEGADFLITAWGCLNDNKLQK
jgi:RHS repeat-associated protein